MANMGVGIGAFLDGAVAGYRTGTDMRRQKRLDDLSERQQKLREQAAIDDKAAADRDYQLRADAAKRLGALQDYRMQTEREDRAYQQQERAANAPLVAAERDSRLRGLRKDADFDAAMTGAGKAATNAYNADITAARGSITRGTDEKGLPAFGFGGQTYGSRADAEKAADASVGSMMDHYAKVGVPKVQQAYLQAGQPEKAQAYGKWVQDKKVQDGMSSAYRIFQAAQMQDWDRVSSGMDEILGNNGYMDLSGYDGDASPVKDKDGKTVGIKVQYTDKATGRKFEQTYTNMDEFQQGVLAVVNPEAVFDHNTKILEAQAAAKTELQGKVAFEQVRHDNAIDLEREKALNKIAEENAKLAGGGDDKIRKALSSRISAMEQNDLSGSFATLPESEKVDRAAESLGLITAKAKEMAGAPAAGQPGPAATPVQSSALPANGDVASPDMFRAAPAAGMLPTSPQSVAAAQGMRNLTRPPQRGVNILRRPGPAD